jgi:hypothetical protein
MKIVRSLDETTWRRFVDEQPAGNIFHTPEMFQVFERTARHRPTLWATTDDGGNALALLLPVQITLKGGLLRRLTTRAVVYGSVLCQPTPAGKRALADLLQAYTREMGREPLFTELRNLSDLGDLEPILTGHGFVYEEHLNYLIDLDRPPEDVMRSFSRRTRKKIRQGLKRENAIIEEINHPGQIPVFYDLLSRTYAQAQVPLADRSLFEAAFEVLYPRGMIKFFLVRVGDAYVAASAELVYKDVIYGWYGGMDRAYSKYTPNELLMWHILSWGMENGYRVYDFGGAGKPD